MAYEKDLVLHIIIEQEAIVGPLAWNVAKRIKGIKLGKNRTVSITGSLPKVVDSLVIQYEKLFGPASREVCRDAARPFLSRIPEGSIPAVLK